MRVLMLIGWLLVPIAGATWYYGPGQSYLQTQRVADILADADLLVANGDYALAVQRYTDALQGMPAERTADVRRVRLARAKAQMNSRGGLTDATAELDSLVDELRGDSTADPKMLADAENAFAGSRYYMTWLMRLEGTAKEAWEPEIEAARQTYRLLAESAEAAGNVAAAKLHRDDLESSIRLARMDLGELQGLPLPSQ